MSCSFNKESGLKRLKMRYGKETILYNILYVDNKARTIIPEVVNAWNLTPHRFIKSGETVSIDISRTLYIIKGFSSSDYVHIDVKQDRIDITLDPNDTNATRQARVSLNISDPTGTHKLLQFVIHQN